MLTRETVMKALEKVNDPEIHRSIVELGMVKEVEISPEGAVSVTVALTIKGCPLQDHIQGAVEAAVRELPGVSSVDVHLTVMSDQQRQDLMTQLRGGVEENRSPLLQSGADTVFIGIASGKGGVGKSTVTVNLAVALSRMGFNVGIMDCDIYGSSVPQMLGVDRRPTVIDRTIMPVEAFGVKIISMGFFVPENRPVVWRGPMLGKALQQFFNDVHWGDLDFMLLDLPPGTGDIALDVHRLLPHAKEIIVTTPHPTAAYVAYRAGRMAIETEHELIGVIENMSYFRSEVTDRKEYVFGQGGGDRLSEMLDTPLLARIPLGNPQIEDTVISEDGTEAHQAFVEVAKEIAKLAPTKVGGKA